MAYQNLLDYVKFQTKVDFDSQDVDLAEELGPFVDCTSNQIDSYLELLTPRRASLLRKSAELALSWKDDFPNVPLEELAGEIGMVNVSLTLVPHISGLIHVMANPKYATSSVKLIENGERIAELCHRIDPSFDLSRLCIKVVSTWEGFQACRKLKQLNVKTLATTLFTLEQAMLAAEVGCVYVSPFLHPLDAVIDGRCNPDDNILDVCVQAQAYFQQYAYTTQVKAAAVMSTDEVKQLVGVAAMTLPAPLLQELAKLDSEDGVEQHSLFLGHEGKNPTVGEQISYLNDHEKYEEAFGASRKGVGKACTGKAIEIFCGYQTKLETMMEEELKKLPN